MGDNRKLRTGEANSREPSELRPVGDGSGRDRRPGPPEASPEEEARHEAPPHHPQAPLYVRPENAPRDGRGPEEQGVQVPPCVSLVPPQGHGVAQGDHPAERRSVDADRLALGAPGNAEWRVKDTGQSQRRRSHRRAKTYDVEIVRFIDAPRNGANAYASLSTSERYECLMKRLAEIWSAISRRRSAGAAPSQERRKAA